MKSNQIEVELTNRRYNLLWEKIRNENNYDNNAKYFQELFDISEYDDEDEFSDNYLINLVKNKADLGNKEFTNKIIQFYSHYLDGDRDITENQYHKLKKFYNLNAKEEFLLSEFLEILPYERYLVVMNYFTDLVGKKSLGSSLEQIKWLDCYPKRDIDFFMISESKFILWKNNPDLLDAEYEECKDDLSPYG